MCETALHKFLYCKDCITPRQPRLFCTKTKTGYDKAGKYIARNTVTFCPNALYWLFTILSFLHYTTILTKLTISVKLLHYLAIVGGFIFCITSNWLCRGFTQTLWSFMNILFPIYWSSILNNWHFLGDIFNQFFLKAFKRSSNFAIWAILLGVNNNKSSIITLQYFLLCKLFKIVFI